MTCNRCTTFFAIYRCGAPEECDCPKCQGLCECDSDENLSIDRTPDPLDEVPEGCLSEDNEE